MRQNANFRSRFKLISVVQAPGEKYLACAVGQINATDSRVLHSQEGRTRRHERGARDAVDAMASLDERGLLRTEKSCGPGTPTLVSSFAEFFREATAAKQPGHRGATVLT